MCTRSYRQLLVVAVVLSAGLSRGAPPVKELPAPVADPQAWSVAPIAGNTFTVGEENGQPILIAGNRSLILVSHEAHGPGTELVVRFRTANAAQPARLTLAAGLMDPNNLKDAGLFVTTNVAAGSVGWVMSDPTATGSRRPEVRGSYRARFAVERSLSWPESLRKNVEADMVRSASAVNQWMTLEVRLSDGAYEAALDGIPLTKVTDEGLPTRGMIRLTASAGVELAGVSVNSAVKVEADPVFSPVSLQSLLNAGEIDGRRIDHRVFSQANRVEVAGVPFVLAEPDERGHDHVDLGVSWFRQGNLDGRFSGRGGDAMTARWAGAMIKDPARLTLRLPMTRYRALHLLAAADSDPDSVPVVTAQFYRAQAGFPKDFSAQAPAFSATSTDARALPVKTADGATGNLYLVTIPIEPGALAEFDDLEYVELELTKQTRLYRASPDPLYYSSHAAGLPSSVRVFALTAERPKVQVALEADAYGHIWTAPAKPRYTVTLRHRSGPGRDVQVELATTSLDGKHQTAQQKTVSLPATGQATLTLELAPQVFGLHHVRLTVTDGDQVWNERRDLAYLQEDTRDRGDWDFGRGPLFGFYNWGGGHNTPAAEKQLLVMALAGIETIQNSYDELVNRYNDEALDIIKRFKLFTMKFAGGGDHYVTARFAGNLKNQGLEKAREILIEELTKRASTPGPHSRPIFLSWYPEPSIGPITHGIFPQYIGQPPHQFSDYERERYEMFRNGFVEGARIVRENFPGVKNLMPHGDPTFVIHFLQNDPETVAPLLDGSTVDIPCFERLPEQQFHQVSLHRLYMAREEFRKAGIEKPLLPMYEGPCIPSGPGALTDREQADLTIRNSLILLVYGVDIQNGGFPAFDTASYWGEQHYGFGILNRIALETPKVAYAALATHTRHLNRANYDGWINTGSHSVFALRFKHYKTGEPVYVMWTLRGKRPVTLAAPEGARVYDQMDNVLATSGGGQLAFTLDQSPCYVRGLTADPAITLGESDHSDAQPAPTARKLANFGDGSWTITTQVEEGYEGSHRPYIHRFPSPMTVRPTEAPAAQGGRALSVHLPDPEKDRVFVPYYSVLTPANPIEITGKASHLGLWVKASSDWGRAIYFVRDAEGEQWINVGTRGAWNCDDLHSWMSFNFDGWRYLRMEMPANSPYDQFREAGSTWWGPYSSGDGNIDLPLTLEKVVLERRTHVMYVDGPEPADRSDILLGDLYAEYADQADATAEAVRQSRIRMPVPADVPGLDNPIEELTASGVGAPIQIERITLPAQDADGTRCFVHFPTVEGAVTYDVWASAYADGRGALKLGKEWKAPGGQIRGLRPNQDFYLFVTWTDGQGKVSRPSPALKINLEDFFAMK